MSHIEKSGDDERTVYRLTDHGIDRGWFSLDSIYGDVDFSPGALSHVWVSPQDGEAWRALVEHMAKFAPKQKEMFAR